MGKWKWKRGRGQEEGGKKRADLSLSPLSLLLASSEEEKKMTDEETEISR
jgi:hypothetical protein